MNQSKTHGKEVKQCVMRLIHRSLVCLGDLTRYKLELDLNWDPMVANRYYKMAIAIDPNIGMPHNQLATIAGGNNYGLDAIYYFLRRLISSLIALIKNNFRITISFLLLMYKCVLINDIIVIIFSTLCSEPFEKAEENLKRNILIYSTCTIENNSVHRCVSRLFSLLRLWDQENPNSDKINQECQVSA